MKQISTGLFSFALLVSLVTAQFKAQAAPPALPVNTQGLGYAQQQSLFDPSRFDMNHSFSMSMSTFGNQSLTLGAYTNQMNYLLKDNLRLNAQFSLVQPTGGMNPLSNNGLPGQVYYGASLDYQPTDNFFVRLSMNNYPRYSFYNPYSRLWMTR